VTADRDDAMCRAVELAQTGDCADWDAIAKRLRADGFQPAEAPVQRVQIDVENEDPVKQINEAWEISRAAAEEGDRVELICDQGSDFVYIPNVVLVRALAHKAIQRFAGLWICEVVCKLGQWPRIVIRIAGPHAGESGGAVSAYWAPAPCSTRASWDA
jgi:hypothetical protein